MRQRSAGQGCDRVVVLERMESEWTDEFPISTCESRGIIAGRGFEAPVEVGVRASGDVFGLRAADCCRWTSLRWFRFGIPLFNRCGNGVRPLVVSGSGGPAQHA